MPPATYDAPDDDLPCCRTAVRRPSSRPSQPVWLDDHQVLFHAVRARRERLCTFDAETGARRAGDELAGDSRAGFSVDADRRYVAQARASLDEPARSASTTAQASSAKRHHRLTTPSCCEQRPAAQWERFDVDARRYTIEAWLLKPPDFDPSKQYPVVLDVHGGPHGFYGYGFNAMQQTLATHGFLVVFSQPARLELVRPRVRPAGAQRLGRRGLPGPDGRPGRGAASGRMPTPSAPASGATATAAT